MSLQPSDYVGWTVTVHENDELCPVGVFYCVSVTPNNSGIQLAGWGDARDQNAEGLDGINWYALPSYCTRLRQGDFAP